MKKQFNIFLFSVALGTTVVALDIQAAPQKTGKTKPVLEDQEEIAAELIERKSVFEEPVRPPYTDPFFPRTKRLPYRKEPDKTSPAPDPRTVLISQIALKGISGPVGRRLALINNYTFAAGESGTVKTSKGTANIKVLEVKERSAVIQIENDPEPKEIHLRPEP